MTYLWWEFFGIIAYNIIVMLVYGMDKWKARRNAWRISEKALIFLAFFLGAIGACLGMILFNHKTAKMKFRLLIPVALIINLCLFMLFFWESIT